MNFKLTADRYALRAISAPRRLRLGSSALAVAGLVFVIGCSSPTPSYPITPQPGEDGAAVDDGGAGDTSGRATNIPPMGGDAYATARNIVIPTVDPDAPYPPPPTDMPDPPSPYPPPDEG